MTITFDCPTAFQPDSNDRSVYVPFAAAAPMFNRAMLVTLMPAAGKFDVGDPVWRTTDGRAAHLPPTDTI